MTATIELTLFVTGRTLRAADVIAGVRHACDHRFGDAYVLEVIDVHDQPERTARDGVLATPTLIASGPARGRLLVGDVTDVSALAEGLAEAFTGRGGANGEAPARDGTGGGAAGREPA